MSKRIGCLSYVPIGYGTPQLRYLVDSLSALYGTLEPPAFFVPAYAGRKRLDASFPRYSIYGHSDSVRRQAALEEFVPRVADVCRALGFRRIFVYGAGVHTHCLLQVWRDNGGPPIQGVFVTAPGEHPAFEGHPVHSVDRLDELAPDLVVLSSETFERTMAGTLARLAPRLARIALYDPNLTLLPDGVDGVWRRHLEIGPDQRLASAGARWIDSRKPDILVCSHFRLLEAVAGARHRPEVLIYYALETPVEDSTDGTPLREYDRWLHRELKDRMTVCLYPETHRRRRHEEMFGLADVPGEVIYNTHPHRRFEPAPPGERNGRFLVQGSLRAGRTYLEYLPEVADLSARFDLYGEAAGDEWSRDLLSAARSEAAGNYRYLGHIGARRLAGIRRRYSHVAVMWSPSSFDGLHACPNKFFEAIASGVPPLAAPHPQCREIIERYGAGLLLDDWSLPAFRRGLGRAAALGPAGYAELVARCADAHGEICWERQFERVRKWLPRPDRRRRVRRRRFVLVDPLVRDRSSGHHHEAAKLLGAARAAGFETWAMVDSMLDVPLPEAACLQPVFTATCAGRPSVAQSRETGRRFTRTLARGLRAARVGAGDHVFVRRLRGEELAALCANLTAPLLNGATLHLDLGRAGRDAGSADAVRVLGHRLGESVRLYAASEDQAAAWTLLSRVACGTLPHPAVREGSTPSGRLGSEPVRVAYLGDAVEERGFSRLPSLVEEAVRAGLAPKVHFDIQVTPSPLAATIAPLLQELRVRGGLSMRLLAGPLPQAEFDEMLRVSDIVVCPFDEGRGASLVVQAVCAGAQVIVPTETASACGLPPDSPWIAAPRGSLGTKLVWAVEHRDESKAWAARLQSEFRARHTAEALLACLMADGHRPQPEPVDWSATVTSLER